MSARVHTASKEKIVVLLSSKTRIVLVLAALVVVALVACSAPPPPPIPTPAPPVEVTRIVKETVVVKEAVTVKETVVVKETVIPPQPTPAPQPTKAPSSNQTQYSDNFVIGDTRPDAPELAKRGPFGVGVQTLKVVNPNQLDIAKVTDTNTNPRYDRPLTLEVWYPATIPAGVNPIAWYSDVLGTGPGDPNRPNTPFQFAGRALRDAAPDAKEAPYPLVIVSHGYPGSRVLLTYLTENLASKGYVVVAIDHTESLHGDKGAFSSTLLNRALDDNFVIDQMSKMGAKGSSSFLAGLVNADKTAIVGYSMGGYGALNATGVGINQATVNTYAPAGKLAARQVGNPEYMASLDPRIKTIVAFAPWGGTVFDADGLKGLKVPALFIGGTADTTAGFANIKRFFDQAVNSDRYFLVYENGAHEIAVNPPPQISMGNLSEYLHYQEPAWDNGHVDNINQHFVTAFLGMQLKGLDYKSYLDVIPLASDGKSSLNADGTPKTDHTYWKGFKSPTALGLEMYHKLPQQ